MSASVYTDAIPGGNTMNLTDRLYESARDIWEGYHQHPFVTGIGDGTLPPEKFRFFMVQDYLYLYEYSRLFALGVVKAKDHDLMRTFSEMTDSTLNGEMKTHQNYMARLNISRQDIASAKMSLVNSSYTNYMLSIGYSGDVLDILVAVLSCAWSYEKIGNRLTRVYPQSTDHPLYGEWVRSYISEDYRRIVRENIDLVNAYGKDISPERYAHLEDIFIRCSRYEGQFWEMSWNMEL